MTTNKPTDEAARLTVSAFQLAVYDLEKSAERIIKESFKYRNEDNGLRQAVEDHDKLVRRLKTERIQTAPSSAEIEARVWEEAASIVENNYFPDEQRYLASVVFLRAKAAALRLKAGEGGAPPQVPFSRCKCHHVCECMTTCRKSCPNALCVTEAKRPDAEQGGRP